MRSVLVAGACPGFGLRMCLSCKRTWVSSAPEACVATNRYCPLCIPNIAPVLRDWECNPDRLPAEERIQRRLAELRRQRERSVAAQREEIGKARRTA